MGRPEGGNPSSLSIGESENFDSERYLLTLQPVEGTQKWVSTLDGKEWVSKRVLAKMLGADVRTLVRYYNKSKGHEIMKGDFKLYSLDEAKEAIKEYFELPRVDEDTKIYIDRSGVEWVASEYLDPDQKIGSSVIHVRLAKLQFIKGRNSYGKETKLFRLTDISPLVAVVEAPYVDRDKQVYTDKEGNEWAPEGYFIKKYKNKRNIRKDDTVPRSFFVRELAGVKHVQGRDGSRLYNVAEAIKKFETYFKLPQVDKKTEIYTDSNGVGWSHARYFSEKFNVDDATFLKKANGLETLQGKAANGRRVPLYRVSEVQEVFKDFLNLPRVDKETNIYISEDGTMWASSKYFYDKFPILKNLATPQRLSDILMGVSSIKGRNDSNNKCVLFKLPDAEYFIEHSIIPLLPATLDVREKQAEHEKLKQDYEDFIADVAESDSELAEHFRALIRACGGSGCVDILYTFRPEYKALPPEFVGGMLADYLGDYLLNPGEFHPKDIKLIVGDLSNLTLRDAVYINLKNRCLRYYFDERRKGKRNSQEIIYGYLDYLVEEEFAGIKSKELDDIIQQVILYYDSVLKDFHKPEKFVDTLSTDREFPDINQRINMKELADEKRMLIADEMGLGKSASVIMAKEQLGVQCALVVVPSNVRDTWQRYLSDSREQGGYFKEGQAPKVLIVDSPHDIEKALTQSYDYILISQERLKGRYVQTLTHVDYDMLIVDEVHKVKALEGKRAPYLFELAERVQGEGKYTALLSGTPVPNKIHDIAVVLKLLYPEMFKSMDDNKLVDHLIRGDIKDLRKLLLPHMQMKKLEEGIEMPKLTERIVEFTLNPAEQQVYQVFIEDDELEPTEKMRILMQFLLNPRLVDSTPGIKSAKIEKTSEVLNEVFQTHRKVVMFVNIYVGGIIRGEDTILEDLNLPPDVTVRSIHGENKPERASAQEELKNTKGKILLLVSGDVADVGVDFSSADHVVFYNEPWTEYQRKQELGRVYRPGLKHDLESTTLIASGTIEEGIHNYILRKYQAVEKLLRDIPRTAAEQKMLEHDEKATSPDKSINPELARYYFAVWDQMMQMFGHGKKMGRGMGEVGFKEFLEKYGHQYASGYIELGNRSYQANVNRVTGTLIHEMIQSARQPADTVRILDLASGPEMLKQHIGDEYTERVFSTDINKEHFANRQTRKAAVASMLRLPFATHTFDYANTALSLHYLNFAPIKGRLERLQALMEINRVLKPGGRAILSIVFSMQFKDFDRFKEVASELGFRVVEGYTDHIAVGEQYKSLVITLEKVKDIDENISPETMSATLGTEKLEGLKFVEKKDRIKKQRRIVKGFNMKGKHRDVHFNEHDIMIMEEEKTFLKDTELLKQKYGTIENIPDDEIIQRQWRRFKKGKKYILIKQPQHGSGMMVAGQGY